MAVVGFEYGTLLLFNMFPCPLSTANVIGDFYINKRRAANRSVSLSE
jgi:hypothetical protein